MTHKTRIRDGLFTWAALLGLPLVIAFAAHAEMPDTWPKDWPNTDLSKMTVDPDSIVTVSRERDFFESIDDPKYVPVSEADYLPDEPVISVSINGDARAYPQSVMIWHEIVNTEVGGKPVSVTFCPLCNSAMVFDRRVGDRVLDFGVSSMLRYNDLVMYDRQTESWWQQFVGKGIVGELAGTELEQIPARLESFDSFKARHPDGRVLVPNDPNKHPYGASSYAGYEHDTPEQRKRISDPEHRVAPDGIAPLSRVVRVNGEAWHMDLVRREERIELPNGVIITWEPGQKSIFDTKDISKARDVGNVTVQKRTEDGLKDIPYSVDFAFAFHAFHPDAPIHTSLDTVATTE